MRDVDDVENGGWERRSILVRHRPPVGLLFSRFSLAFKPGLHCLGRLSPVRVPRESRLARRRVLYKGRGRRNGPRKAPCPSVSWIQHHVTDDKGSRSRRAGYCSVVANFG